MYAVARARRTCVGSEIGKYFEKKIRNGATFTRETNLSEGGMMMVVFPIANEMSQNVTFQIESSARVRKLQSAQFQLEAVASFSEAKTRTSIFQVPLEVYVAMALPFLIGFVLTV